MIHLKQVLSRPFLRELAESSARGIENLDCFYDQCHYVNRRFVAKHREEFAALIIGAIRDFHPGITAADLTYVNDFLAPVNLANAQIAYTESRENRYGWHYDSIDAVLRPCYNVWIPIYRQSALRRLDDLSIFDVLTPATCPKLYDSAGNPKCHFLWSSKRFLKHDRELLAALVGVPLATLDEYFYFHTGERTDKISAKDLTPLSVVRPTLGDCYVFDSSCLHASGPSSFERIGVSVKFLVNRPELGFRVLPHFAAPYEPYVQHAWWGMFVSWYEKSGSFFAYEEVLDSYIARERHLLRQNAGKLECVRGVLRQAAEELGVGAEMASGTERSLRQ